MLIPRRKVPGLVVETLNHGRFDLARGIRRCGVSSAGFRTIAFWCGSGRAARRPCIDPSRSREKLLLA
jgi:hypothetical protein